MSEGAVGLYGIATLAAHRRKGYGTALTLRPLLDARDEGHTLAVLQASAEGQGVYARLGFLPTGHYTEYKTAGRDLKRAPDREVQVQPPPRPCLGVGDRPALLQRRRARPPARAGRAPTGLSL